MKKEINIVGVSARICGGKDTFASMIRYFNENESRTFIDWRAFGDFSLEHKWKIKKFAYKLKLVASILTGIPVENFEDQEFKKTYLGSEWDFIHNINIIPCVNTRMSVRYFLQVLGTNAIRNNLHENTWLNALWCDYTPEQKWIITDCRFENEAKSIKDRGGIIVRLTRNSKVQSSHESETALDNYDFDYVIDNENTSLEEMYNLVEEFYEKHLK